MAAATSDQHTSFVGKLRDTGPFLTLLIALLLLYLTGPILDEFRKASLLLDITYAGLLIAAVYAASKRRATLWLAIALGVPTMLSLILRSFLDLRPFSLANLVLLAVFLSFIAITVLREVFRAEKVTANEIFGAICVYLLLGSIWVAFYGVVLYFNPDAFSFANDTIPTGSAIDIQRDYFSRLHYFSFVTLTTLGYGDILPRSDLARMLAWMQAVTGQLFIAVLIARLVGEYMVHRRSST
jgi:hypothetical protein